MSEELLIHKRFAGVAARCADRVAVKIKADTTWKEFTYKDIEKTALKVGRFLVSKQGFKKGESAALILENRLEWGIIYLGIMQAGMTCVPLNPQLSRKEIKNFISDSATRIVFCSSNLFENKVKQVIEGSTVKAVVLDSEGIKDGISFNEIEGILPQEDIWPEVRPEDIASLIYTSGTTGESKGVLLSHRNICSNFLSIQRINICFASDNFLSILPLYHSYAFMVTLIVPFFLGARVTYALGFNPQDISTIIKQAGVTILVGVPQLFCLMHKAIFSRMKKVPSFIQSFIKPLVRATVHNRMGRLRMLVSGGARLEPEIGRELTNIGLKLIEGYGLTEASPVVTINSPEKTKFGSVENPYPMLQ